MLNIALYPQVQSSGKDDDARGVCVGKHPMAHSKEL